MASAGDDFAPQGIFGDVSAHFEVSQVGGALGYLEARDAAKYTTLSRTAPTPTAKYLVHQQC